MTTAKSKSAAPALPVPADVPATAGRTESPSSPSISPDPLDAVTGVQSAAFRSCEEAMGFGVDAFDALVEAGAVFARGFQDMSQMMVGFVQASVEESVAASRRMMGVRNLGDLLDIQAGATRAGFDRVIEGGGRLSDLSVRMFEEAFTPIGARIGAAAGRMARPAG